MPTVQLSSHFVGTAKCLSGRKVDYYDTVTTGFVLEVRATGGATYYLRYRDTHNRQRQHKIGDSQSISFDKARQLAKTLRAKVVLGESPLEDRKAQRSIPTFAEFTQERYLPFIKGYKKSWMSDVSCLNNHVLPRFGCKHMDEITYLSIVEFHHAMLDKGYAKATSNRMVILMSYMYNLAKKWKIAGAENNPTTGVPLYEANNARERYLTAEETQRLKLGIEASGNTQLKYIVALLLLTGARKRELLDARWEDFDIGRRNWRIPISKSGRSRHVPLSSAALEVLSQLPRFKGCPYVVPNTETLVPFASVYSSWNTARKAAGMPDVRMHDLRHSMASNLVNSGRSIYEVSKILGHSQMKTSQRYAHLAQETLIAAVDAAANATGTEWSEKLEII